MSRKIAFFTEDIQFTLKNKQKIRLWLTSAIENEGFSLQSISFIFCSDEYLLKINQQYLNHDTYTDIITFDNSETPKKIYSDIFISVERVTENATHYQTTFQQELLRILIHGVLHLMGYQDKTPNNKRKMTQKEDFYLQSF